MNEIREEKMNEPKTAEWRRRMDVLRKAFPSPWREVEKDRVFENSFAAAVSLLDRMKHPRVFRGQNAWQGYLGNPELPDYGPCREARLNEEMKPLDGVIEDLVGLFDGLPNWNHPQIMANVAPPPNTASIIGAALGQIFNPNILEGEYSWNIAKAEIEAAAMAARLIGWDPHFSGGLFTFGGTGCYLYGLKLALTSVLGKESRSTGIREDGQVLVSREGHYAKLNCTDWTGLGMNNIREIEVDRNNAMDLAHLEDVLAECRRKNKPVVMVVCTAGTTDAFAVDPVGEVRGLIDRYENAKGCPRPFLYADAVIGWSWLAFGGYDFKANPLQFSENALAVLESNYQKVEPLRHSDALGIDLHKTGWAPYASSLFMVRDYDRFAELMARPSPAYLQDRTPYNPFKFTLETSRAGSGALAGWAAFRLFGREGFRVMLGRIIEVGLFLRQLIECDRNLVCVNPDNHGFVTLFRVYPKHIDAKKQYESELNDPARREELQAYNLLQQRVANKLYAMLRDPAQRVPGWEHPPYTSFTSGYRPPAYAPEEKDRKSFIYALKSFPMSPHSNELSMLMVRNYVLKARDLVIAEILEGDHCLVGNGENGASEAFPPGFLKPECWYGENERIDRRFIEAEGAPPVGETPFFETSAPAGASVLDLLRLIPVCSHLGEDRLTRLAEVGRRESAAAGTVLFSEGDRADRVYLVLKGSVRITKRETDGRELELAVYGPGGFFGEMALFESGVRSAGAVTAEPCEFYVIDGPVFLDLAV